MQIETSAVTYSSGNHALGLARAAHMMGSSALIVMPSDGPAARQAAVRAMGAQIVTYDRDTQESADVVARLVVETGRIEVLLAGRTVATLNNGGNIDAARFAELLSIADHNQNEGVESDRQ